MSRGRSTTAHVAGSAQYVSEYPIASKRVLRALLKGVDLCASEPEAVARRMVEGGFAQNYVARDVERRALDRWREFDPEDSLRFYALRLHDVGMITSSPNELIARKAATGVS